MEWTFNNKGLVGRGYFITINYANFIVENINVEDCACGVARIHYSIDGIVRNCIGKKPNSNTAPYGEFLNILYSTNINVYNIIGYYYRRCVDYVGCCYCNTYNSKGFQSGFTTHGLLAKKCNFINCEFQQLINTIENACVIGNLSYFYDKDICFIGCKFLNGSRPIYVVNPECNVKIINCIFENQRASIYNNGEKVEILNCNFKNIQTLIFNNNDSYDTNVNIENSSVNSIGTASTNVIETINTERTFINIKNSSFKGTNKIPLNKMIIENSSFDFEPNANVTLDSGSRINNSHIYKNIGGRDDVRVLNSIFKSFTHNDAENARNVVIMGCLKSGSINVANDTTIGNYISDNINIPE